MENSLACLLVSLALSLNLRRLSLKRTVVPTQPLTGLASRSLCQLPSQFSLLQSVRSRQRGGLLVHTGGPLARHSTVNARKRSRL